MIPIIDIFATTANVVLGGGSVATGLPVINTAVVTSTTSTIATTVVTTNQNVNVFTSINSGGTNQLTNPMVGTQPPSKFAKILATIAKILCGLMIAIFIVNVFIYIFQLGPNHLRAEMSGGGIDNTTKVGVFRIILRKLDILEMISDGIGWLTDAEKNKKLSEAEANRWIELNPVQRNVALPTFAPQKYQLTAKYKKAVNLMGDGPTGTGMSQEKAAKQAGVSIPSIECEGTYTTSTELQEVRSGSSDFTDADWGKISNSSQSIAKFFGWGQKDCKSGCGKIPCGNVYIRAAHPLDICVARRGKVGACDEHLCKDYTYYVQLVMSKYPEWFQHLTPQSKALFHRAYVNSGTHAGNNSVVTIPPSSPDSNLGHPWLAGAQYEFKYEDKGEDIRWTEHEILKDTRIEDDYTHTGGSNMADLQWPNQFGGGHGQMGICCDPYGDNQTFGDYPGNDSAPHGDKGEGPAYKIMMQTNEYVSAAAMGSLGKPKKPNSPQELQMVCGLAAPRYKAVHWDDFSMEKWGLGYSLEAAIDDLIEENKAARALPKWGEPVHEFIDFADLPIRHSPPYNKYAGSYRGVRYYHNGNAAGFKAYAFAWTTIEKQCACAGDAAFGAGTSQGAMFQLIVGAEYKLSMKRVGKRICKDETFVFPGDDTAENEANFSITCGKGDGPPGDSFVNITHGYGNVGS